MSGTTTLRYYPTALDKGQPSDAEAHKFAEKKASAWRKRGYPVKVQVVRVRDPREKCKQNPAATHIVVIADDAAMAAAKAASAPRVRGRRRFAEPPPETSASEEEDEDEDPAPAAEKPAKRQRRKSGSRGKGRG